MNFFLPLDSLLLLALSVVSLTSVAVADSPLTSTDFHPAYEAEPMVSHAADSKLLDRAMLNFLTHPDNSSAKKLAVMNAIGWQFDDNWGNSAVFLEHLLKSKGLKSEYFQLHLAKFSSEELFLYGYLFALENYLDDEKLLEILPLLRVAVAKHRESYSANLVLTLVECQLQMHDGDNWQLVWERYAKFLANEELKRPLNAEARATITDYLKLYEEG
ncbi:MAG: hypothetical protein QM496_16700 [Verrucomicrobiota bacterium]